LFNVLPIYPLDGGQIAHALLWFFFGRARSLTIVSFVGLLAGTALLGVLFTLGQWWLMVMSLFLVGQALIGMLQADVLSRPGWEHLAPSLAYLHQGEYDRAVAECDKAVGVLQDDRAALAMAHLRRGVAQQARDHHTEAVADAAEAIRLAPHAVTFFTRGEIHLLQGQYAEAIEDFTQALQHDPNLALAQHQRGDAYFRQGQVEQAQVDLALAVKLDRSLPEFYPGIDDPSYRRQQLEWAIAVCGTVLQMVIVPGGEECNRAAEHLTAGRSAEALAEADKALRINPQLASARVIRGEALRLLGRLDEAAAEIQAAQQLDPASACPQLAMLALLVEEGKYDEALALCEAALQANPEQTMLRTIQAEVYQKQGNRPQAIAVYTEILRREPDNVEARYQRGIQYRKLGQLDLAIADYDECLRREPDSSEVYYFRAIACKARGDYQRALADYRAALKLNPDNENFHNNLAELLATCPDVTLRDGAEAVRHATRACELTDWQNANILDTLASAYAEVANFAEAIRWQQTALQDADFSAKSGVKARGRLRLYEAGKTAQE
jgi:tetratricopeptide (TPR) repeat protein